MVPIVSVQYVPVGYYYWKINETDIAPIVLVAVRVAVLGLTVTEQDLVLDIAESTEVLVGPLF